MGKPIWRPHRASTPTQPLSGDTMLADLCGQHFMSSFRCGYCKTRIDFADAAPEWQEDPKRKAEREAAAEFLARFAGREVEYDRRHSAQLEGEERELMRGLYEHCAHVAVGWDGKVLPDLRGDAEMRAFPCPTCNAWIRPTDGIVT